VGPQESKPRQDRYTPASHLFTALLDSLLGRRYGRKALIIVEVLPERGDARVLEAITGLDVTPAL
jgi:hypothetical protein